MICRKATVALPDANFLSSRAQNRHFCVRNGDISLVLAPSEHKIGVFVRFLPSKPPFSGISSTKSAFLCAFAGNQTIGNGNQAVGNGNQTIVNGNQAVGNG